MPPKNQQQQDMKKKTKQQQQQQKKKGVVKRKPHFFKVLLGDFTHHLRIPPKFLKHISGVESKRVILHGPSGSKWHVELGRSTEDTFLTTGWRKFVKDHSLKEYEFLVFQYDGNMHFTVLIFDTSACEREDAFEIIKHEAQEDQRLKAQEAANAFTSPFPYIVIRMTPTHVYRPYLNVPNRFSREHLPQKKSIMVLRDPSGRSWAVNYSPNLRCQIAKGWAAFVRANKLEEGDFCALELVGPVELCVHIFRVVEEA